MDRPNVDDQVLSAIGQTVPRRRAGYHSIFTQLNVEADLRWVPVPCFAVKLPPEKPDHFLLSLVQCFNTPLHVTMVSFFDHFAFFKIFKNQLKAMILPISSSLKSLSISWRRLSSVITSKKSFESMQALAHAIKLLYYFTRVHFDDLSSYAICHFNSNKI